MTTENRLREAAPDTVYKEPDFIDIGGTKTRYRDILLFDLGEYTGSKISNAVLLLCWYYPEGSKRTNDTIIEVYRPASAWNPDYVSWNKKDNGIPWTNAGGDWYDKNGVLQGRAPYATITIKGNVIPDKKYYDLDVTELVKEYISGTYENNGFLIKARSENENYIAFYSSKGENKPLLTVTEEVVLSAKIMIQCLPSDDPAVIVESLRDIVGDREIEVYKKEVSKKA